MPTVADAPERAVRIRHVFLECLSIAWMVIEGAVAIGSGIIAHSLLLMAFGIDLNGSCGRLGNVNDKARVGQHRDVAAVDSVRGCTCSLCQEPLQIGLNRSVVVGYDVQSGCVPNSRYIGSEDVRIRLFSMAMSPPQRGTSAACGCTPHRQTTSPGLLPEPQRLWPAPRPIPDRTVQSR